MATDDDRIQAAEHRFGIRQNSPQAAGSLQEELAKVPYEPLLPVEKKLIAGSLLLGLGLLALLVWVSYTFFPAP